MADHKMNAAVLVQTGEPLKIITDISMPEPEKGQVLVEIAYSGVCHSQLMEVGGHRGEDKWLPHLLGHEATGIVRHIGESVTKVKPGDRVVLGWIKGQGLEAPGAKYHHQDMVINSGGVTTFSTKSIVAENRLTPLPEGMAMDVGVLFGCAIPTGAGVVLNEVNIEEGQSVVVFGIGGVGSISLQYAKTRKPHPLIAVDVVEEKLETALQFGADHALNAKSETLVDDILELTNGGADYTFDAAGLTKTIETAFEVTRRGGGVCVFASHPAFGEKIALDPFELINGKTIKGSWGGNTKPDEDLPRFFQICRDENIDLEKMFTKRYKLDEINRAFEDMKNGSVLRPLLEINPDIE